MATNNPEADLWADAEDPEVPFTAAQLEKLARVGPAKLLGLRRLHKAFREAQDPRLPKQIAKIDTLQAEVQGFAFVDVMQLFYPQALRTACGLHRDSEAREEQALGVGGLFSVDLKQVAQNFGKRCADSRIPADVRKDYGYAAARSFFLALANIGTHVYPKFRVVPAHDLQAFTDLVRSWSVELRVPVSVAANALITLYVLAVFPVGGVDGPPDQLPVDPTAPKWAGKERYLPAHVGPNQGPQPIREHVQAMHGFMRNHGIVYDKPFHTLCVPLVSERTRYGLEVWPQGRIPTVCTERKPAAQGGQYIAEFSSATVELGVGADMIHVVPYLNPVHRVGRGGTCVFQGGGGYPAVLVGHTANPAGSEREWSRVTWSVHRLIAFVVHGEPTLERTTGQFHPLREEGSRKQESRVCVQHTCEEKNCINNTHITLGTYSTNGRSEGMGKDRVIYKNASAVYWCELNCAYFGVGDARPLAGIAVRLTAVDQHDLLPPAANAN